MLQISLIIIPSVRSILGCAAQTTSFIYAKISILGAELRVINLRILV